MSSPLPRFSAKAHLYLDENDIMQWEFEKLAQIKLEDAISGYEQAEKILNGRKVPVLVSMDAYYIDFESRRYYQNNSTKYFTAGALIVKSVFGRLIANFFMGFNKPEMPMKIVRDKEEGIEWLMGFAKK